LGYGETMGLEEFIGQPRIKRQIKLVVQQGHLGRMPHLGIFGRAGMGKTMLSNLMADELQAKLIYVNGTAVKDPVAFLMEIYKAKESPTVHHLIFIDEAHNLPKRIQENLLSVLEEPAMLCVTVSPSLKKHLNQNVATGQSIRIRIPDNLSFILGTTHKGNLTNTILSRLIPIDLDDYSEEETVTILRKASKIDFGESVYKAISRIGKNVREMKKYLTAFEAYISLKQLTKDQVRAEHMEEFCQIQGIGLDGCDKTDLRYMETLYKNTRVGLASLASMLCISQEEIVNLVEPWLLKKDYIRITPRGRELTGAGIQRIGKKIGVDAKRITFDIGDD